MINAELSHVKTLPEFYTEIRKQHEQAHGHDYCWQHDAMQKLMKHCDTYKELGTHQGASAAAACLTKPKSVSLVDISFEKWRPFESIFRDYCAEHNITLNVQEVSSIARETTGPVDLLLIDSNHQPAHLQQELALHVGHVSKYIVLHDTSRLFGKLDDRLWQVANAFVNGGINPWIVKERCTDNVGYTVLQNTLNT
jgi:hypothetical protein